jgi:predicted metalloenzyme YecM
MATIGEIALMQRRHHQTRNTVSVTLHCKKCGRSTSHAVMDGKICHCLECGKPAPTAYKATQVVVIPFSCDCPKHNFPHTHPDGQRYNLGAIDHRFQPKKGDSQ